VATGFLGGVAALLAVSAAYAAFPGYRQALAAEVLSFLRRVPPGFLATAGVLAAVGEELFFRGLLQPWLGLVPAAVLFGALHVSGPRSWLYYALTAACLGLGLGLLFRVTGSLVAPITAHLTYNLLVTYALAQGYFPVPEDTG